MNPPLARRLVLICVALIVAFTGGEADAKDGILSSAADAGAAAAQALSPGQLVALIAVGFLPALYMIVRARRAAVRR